MKASEKLWAVGLVVLVVAVPLVLKHRSKTEVRADASTACPPGVVASNGDCGSAAASSALGSVAARPLPKLVDLGTTTCAPCKAMIVVLGELERGYPGQLAVEFINVQENQLSAEQWGVRIIPTQVFVGSDGRELFRHTGFFSTDAIVKKWAELGYPLVRKPNSH